MVHSTFVRKFALPILLCLSACFKIKPAKTASNNCAIALKTSAAALVATMVWNADVRAIVINALHSTNKALFDTASFIAQGTVRHFSGSHGDTRPLRDSEKKQLGKSRGRVVCYADLEKDAVKKTKTIRAKKIASRDSD